MAGRLERAGYDDVEQEFEFPFFRDLADPTLTVGTTEYTTATFQFSGSDTVTGRVVPPADPAIALIRAAPARDDDDVRSRSGLFETAAASAVRRSA